jgi:excisionase family DNA binding protein
MEELSTREIAELLGVKIRTVQKYINEHKIFAYRIGGRWKTTRQAVMEFLVKSNEKILGGNE